MYYARTLAAHVLVSDCFAKLILAVPVGLLLSYFCTNMANPSLLAKSLLTKFTTSPTRQAFYFDQKEGKPN
jgi:hypothetical protein